MTNIQSLSAFLPIIERNVIKNTQFQCFLRLQFFISRLQALQTDRPFFVDFENKMMWVVWAARCLGGTSEKIGIELERCSIPGL